MEPGSVRPLDAEGMVPGADERGVLADASDEGVPALAADEAIVAVADSERSARTGGSTMIGSRVPEIGSRAGRPAQGRR